MADDWKKHAPYALEDGKKHEDYNVRRGECYCKRVTWGFNSPKPLDAKFCHCTGCQRLHGAPCQWAAIFHKNSMLFTTGVDNLIFYTSDKKKQERILPCKVYCESCRTPIMDEGRNMCLVFPTLVKGIHTDKKIAEDFAPSCHIFYGDRVIDICDGKPKWTGHKDSSDLVDDKGSSK